MMTEPLLHETLAVGATALAQLQENKKVVHDEVITVSHIEYIRSRSC